MKEKVLKMIKISDNVITSVSLYLSDNEEQRIDIANELYKLNDGTSDMLLPINPYKTGVIDYKDHYVIPLGFYNNIFLNKHNIDIKTDKCIEIYPECVLLSDYDKINKIIYISKEEALRSLRIIEKRINNYKSVYSYNMKTMGDKHTDTLLKLYEPIFLIRDYLINNNLISKDESLEDGINKLNSKIYVIKGDTNELD